jgi:hypothetical protein
MYNKNIIKELLNKQNANSVKTDADRPPKMMDRF